jgi:hypothetical protein
MATTKSKQKVRVKSRATTKRGRTKARITRSKSTPPPIDLMTVSDKATALEVKGERLVVKLSRDSHPDVFEIDQFLKQVQQVQATIKNRKNLRDFLQFLSETEKSVQILLTNHLEDALRKYLR